MSKIRKVYYFDKKSTQEMISFLNNSANDKYVNSILFNPFLIFHHYLPLKLKFLPESFVLKDKKEIKGLITVAPVKSMQNKMEIQKLLFEENAFEDASQLVQYVVSKYKAMGALSIVVKVDDYLPELLAMFIKKCGFSQISYEKLWRVNKFDNAEYDKHEFRLFRNSDAQAVAALYNDALLPHFRPLLGTEETEYKDSLFAGLSYYSEYKYVIEDKNTENITGFISIRTTDNENFIIDIVQAGGIEFDIDSVLSFISDTIKKRRKRFGLYIRTKRYTNKGEEYENAFMQKGFECVQNQIVLTNSSAKVLREPSPVKRFTVLNGFCPSGEIPI